jgi:hypothetical protein
MLIVSASCSSTMHSISVPEHPRPGLQGLPAFTAIADNPPGMIRELIAAVDTQISAHASG